MNNNKAKVSGSLKLLGISMIVIVPTLAIAFLPEQLVFIIVLTSAVLTAWYGYHNPNVAEDMIEDIKYSVNRAAQPAQKMTTQEILQQVKTQDGASRDWEIEDN